MSDDGENDTVAMANERKMMRWCKACLLLALEEVPVEDTCAMMVMTNEKGRKQRHGQERMWHSTYALARRGRNRKETLIRRNG